MSSNFSQKMLFTVATMYYEEDLTQNEIANRLNISRPTISRALTEARRVGIVEILVHRPNEVPEQLSKDLENALGLKHVCTVVNSSNSVAEIASLLWVHLVEQLEAMQLHSGDSLLIGPGESVYSVAHAGSLPKVTGLNVVAAVGGFGEIEPWYQTNELTRYIATKMNGVPTHIHAPATPGPELYNSLLKEPSMQTVMARWRKAKGIVMGIGAAPRIRKSLAMFVPKTADFFSRTIGDISSHFFDASGDEVKFDGSERLVAVDFETLKKIPERLVIATGIEKVVPMIVAARRKYYNRLITTSATAEAMLNELRLQEQNND